jgi:hypothetical protein
VALEGPKQSLAKPTWTGCASRPRTASPSRRQGEKHFGAKRIRVRNPAPAFADHLLCVRLVSRRVHRFHPGVLDTCSCKDNKALVVSSEYSDVD